MTKIPNFNNVLEFYKWKNKTKLILNHQIPIKIKGKLIYLKKKI